MGKLKVKPRVSIRLLHYTGSESRRRYLAEVLEAMGGIEQAKQDTFSFEIYEDNVGHNDDFWTGIARQAWWDIPEGATHHMVMADDMRPCPDFLKALPTILSAVPANPINFFSMRSAPDVAKEKGHWWWRSMTGMWGGAFIIPVAILREMLPWIDAHINPAYKHDDVRIKAYTQEREIYTWQTGPSLMEHIGAAESTLGNSNRLRVARWLWEASAFDIPWHEIPDDVLDDMSTDGLGRDRLDMFEEGDPYRLTKTERKEKYGRTKLIPADFEGTKWSY